MIRICEVTALAGFEVKLAFTDGTNRVIDLEQYLHGPVFEPLRTDPSLFRQVRVDEELGTICWPSGADIDPDVLYEGLTPAWREHGS
ncbi:MAG: DUF2442 domain-containing protein [Dehalococcoidia bacterium]|nr:DUF2442 domain-containing protein [Dehalococcoidia bacterium]